MKPVAETINDDLLRRYDVAGPRYTSYPTADRFVEAFTADDYAQALTMRRGGAAAMNLPLSLYLHIPFCESLCYYCACNKSLPCTMTVQRRTCATLAVRLICTRPKSVWAKQSVRSISVGVVLHF